MGTAGTATLRGFSSDCDWSMSPLRADEVRTRMLRVVGNRPYLDGIDIEKLDAKSLHGLNLFLAHVEESIQSEYRRGQRDFMRGRIR